MARTPVGTIPPDVSAFLTRIGRAPVRDWLAARDSVDGRGAEIARADEIAEAAVERHGLHAEYRAIEREVTRLVDGIEWFARESGGAHGITLRDLAALRLLATWTALALLLREAVSTNVVAILARPFTLFVPLGAPVTSIR